ncbi:MAG: 5-formyltetrahydrofolate cyclo-ligase, partial [Actinomycetota bacterium]
VRSRLSTDERAAAGAAVAERLAGLPEIVGAGAVLGFASFGTELPTDPVMAWVLGSGRRLLMPYVDGAGLRAAEVRSVEDLAPGYRGIREPVQRVAIDPSEADVILVPGVAFDERGRRLGYGGGFYDAFLAGIERRAPRVGLCFDVQIVDEVPAGGGDESVDVIVTPERVIRPA